MRDRPDTCRQTEKGIRHHKRGLYSLLHVAGPAVDWSLFVCVQVNWNGALQGPVFLSMVIENSQCNWSE